MKEELVEGYFIITSDNLMFEVKGIVHPHDRVIAYVRYVPNIEDSSSSDSVFRKIYNLREREEYLSNGFLEYLWFSKSHGRVLQAVPHKKIVQVLDPVEHMNQIRNDKSALSIATSNLVELLIDITGIDRLEIGVTGSQLVGVATEISDIDLVVYGKSTCRKFYNRLRKNFDKIPRLERYEGELLDAHVLFRWGDLTEHHELLHRIESAKTLQGVFESHQFFIRLVKRPQDVKEIFGQIVTENLGVREVHCSIIEDRNSIFTPCTYQVESLDLPKLRQLLSYRGRFTEHVSSGVSVKVRGRLEKVIDNSTGENYQQLILGESPSDYLIPI
ncbi:MAG: nucleotidyltransferase domain-containing protein [Candidatus Thorarchaeota archaeon]